MKVQADHLATDYLDNYAQSSKSSRSFSPSSKPNHRWRNHHRRYANRLRQATSSPNCGKDMCARNHWTAPDFQSINWRFPEKAVPSTTAPPFSLSNLQTSACRKHMRRIGEAGSDKCLSCHLCNEALAGLPQTEQHGAPL
jgi:hypothetical protein